MTKPTCATCRHWAPKSTPRWHTDMGHARCLLASSIQPHAMACGFHRALPADKAAARGEWLARVLARLADPAPHPPVLGPSAADPTRVIRGATSDCCMDSIRGLS